MRSHKNGPDRKNRASSKRAAMIPSTLKACWSGLLVLLLLLFLFTCIASAVENPGPLLTPFALCALYLSALSGGIAGAVFSGRGPIGGLLTGVWTVCAVFLLGALPLPAAAFPASASAIFLLLLIPVSALGGILGTGKTKKRIRRTRQSRT